MTANSIDEYLELNQKELVISHLRFPILSLPNLYE